LSIINQFHNVITIEIFGKSTVKASHKKHDSNQESVLKIIEQIEKLAKLKDDGLITAEEYQIKKKVLLKRI